MTLTIHKGKHRPKWWWLRLKLWRGKESLRYKVTFDFNCVYDLRNTDQNDINKLFGIGYFPHHKDSARFGWRYDLGKKLFILSAYCYVHGQRFTQDVAQCSFQPVICEIVKFPDYYEFTVSQAENFHLLGRKTIPYWHKKKWSYALGVFFGGNRPAPQDMSIKIHKA